MKLSKRSRYLIVILSIVFIFSSIYIYSNRDCFTYSPFDKGPQISSPGYYKALDNGEQYYIDRGNTRIMGLNDEGECKWTYTDIEASYKELTKDLEGNVFATNYNYFNEGSVSSISIDEFSDSGKFLGSVYSVSYDVKNVFDMTSQILDLQFIDEKLFFVTRTDDKILLYSVNLKENNSLHLEDSVSWDDKKEHAIKYCYDYEKEKFYLITGLGNIYSIEKNMNEARLLPYEKEADFNIPYSMAIVDGKLLVSDIGARTVNLYDGQNFKTIATMVKNEDFFADPSIYYSIASHGDKELTLVSGYDAYNLNIDTKILTPINTEVKFNSVEHIRIMLTWVCGLFVILLGIFTVILLATIYYRKVGFVDFTYNFMVVIIIIVISTLIIVRYTNVLYNNHEESTINRISSIGSLIAKNIPIDDVVNIDSVEDYNSESYYNIMEFLNSNLSHLEEGVLFVDEEGLSEKDNPWNDDFYLGINRFFDGRMYFILSTPEELGAIYPLDNTEKDMFGLIEENNIIVLPEYVGYFGTYSLVQVPILSDLGEVVGSVEVGFNQNSFIKDIRAKQIKIIISLCVILLTLVLGLKELFFGIKMFFAKKALKAKELIDSGSVRTPMFLAFVAFYTSIVCGPLFAMELYSDTLNISKEIGVAISYSSTFVTLSIFSFVAASLVNKIPLHKLLALGAIIAFAGEVMAANSGGLLQFIIARSLFGAGAGLILNSLETIIAIQPDKELVTRGFNMGNVATNSAVIVGIALGATVATSFGYRGVYVASAVVLLILLITSIAFYNKNNIPNPKDFVEEVSDSSFSSFIKNKRVIAYVFFLAIPYFLCLGFIDFFLPLEGNNLGLSVESISYILIAIGLISIYLGPLMTDKLLHLFDSYIVLNISATIISLSIIYYAFNQYVLGLVFACIAIGFADSFFQSVQNIYFTQLPESIRYGQGKTLAISNVTIGVAQLGQAYVFAFAIMYSIKTTFLIMGGAFIVLTILFLLFNLGKKEVKTL